MVGILLVPKCTSLEIKMSENIFIELYLLGKKSH